MQQGQQIKRESQEEPQKLVINSYTNHYMGLIPFLLTSLKEVPLPRCKLITVWHTQDRSKDTEITSHSSKTMET